MCDIGGETNGKTINMLTGVCMPLSVGKNKNQNNGWTVHLSLVTVKYILFYINRMRYIRQLSLFCHNGSLESYNSMLLVYCPKRQEFDYHCLLYMTKLAVIDHNANAGRQRTIIGNKESGVWGEGRYRRTWKKISAHRVARITCQPTSHHHMMSMME